MDLLLLALMALAALTVLIFSGFVVMLVVGAAVRGRAMTASAVPSARPLAPETVEQISALVARERTVEAVKVLRQATGLGLADAAQRVRGWSDVMELEAARRAAHPQQPAEDPLRIEAAAVLAASGWHTAEAFLREQRGLSPEAAKQLLESLP